MSSVDHATLPIESSAGAATPAAPDWSTLDIELQCPRCGYNLKMLTSSRCPECGLTFQWDELIRATRGHLNVPIFEYQWRTRPTRSFFGTILRCMFPWMLWRRIPLAANVRYQPLGIFCGLLLIAYLLGFLGQTALGAFLFTLINRRVTWWQAFYPSALLDMLTWAAAALILTACYVFALALFFQTLGKARIKPGHLVRVAAYAWSSVIAWYYVMIFTAMIEWILFSFLGIPSRQIMNRVHFKDLAFATAVVSLVLAARYYLRISMPELVVFIILCLSALAIAVAQMAGGAYWFSDDNPIATFLRFALPETSAQLYDWLLRVVLNRGH